MYYLYSTIEVPNCQTNDGAILVMVPRDIVYGHEFKRSLDCNINGNKNILKSKGVGNNMR